MNINQQKINDLNVVITINIEPTDYKAKVAEAIKNHSKKVAMPGFRKGMAPAGHIKKLYGRSILVDAINNLLTESLEQYIKDNNLEILGQPLPKNDKEKEFQWDIDADESYEFSYELGLAPTISIDFPASARFVKHVIKADNETKEERMNSLRRAYGNMTNPETSEFKDILYSEIIQLSPEGEELNGGIRNTASIRIELVEDEAIRNSLIGLHKGAEFVIDIRKAFGNNTSLLQNLLGIDEVAAQLVAGQFKVVVKNINRLEPAELNNEFFAKVFPDASVTSVEEFEAFVVNEIESQLTSNAEHRLANDIHKYAMEHIKFELPIDFLRRWLQATNKELSEEEINNDFSLFEQNLRWSLIENKIVKDNDLTVNANEVVNLAKQRIAAQFAMYGQGNLSDEKLQEYATNFLGDRERANQLFSEMRSQKVFEYLKNTLNIDEQEIDYKSFLELK